MLRAGDKVQHKTGGSMMIVKAINDTKVHCEWMVGGEVKERWFEAVTLVHYPEDTQDCESLEALDSKGDFMTA
jgi:uncharacterized protein YodC (DUF2158 family)